MLKYLLSYEVTPCENLPAGLPPQPLVVLSPVWRRPALTIEYQDGGTETLEGRTAGGETCDVRVFWTRANPQGPAVCLAIGGDGGLIAIFREGGRETTRGRAFLALAGSLIPGDVLALIGPPPPAEMTPLLLV